MTTRSVVAIVVARWAMSSTAACGQAAQIPASTQVLVAGFSAASR